MHLIGFIIRIYHDARSPERQKPSNSIYFSLSIFLTDPNVVSRTQTWLTQKHGQWLSSKHIFPFEITDEIEFACRWRQRAQRLGCSSTGGGEYTCLKEYKKAPIIYYKYKKRANAGVLWYTCVFEWAPRRMSSEKWRGTSSCERRIVGVGPIAAWTCISSKLVSTDWEQWGPGFASLYFYSNRMENFN